MKKVYKSKFVNVYLENFAYKKNKYYNFHKIFLNNAVMAIITDDNNKILLTQEYRRGVKKIIYGFPGGHIKSNENPLDAIKREVKEETGLYCSKWKKILTYVKDTTYYCGRDHLFTAKIEDCKYEVNCKKSKEILNLTWVTFKQFKKILKSKYNSSGFLACGFYFLNNKKLN